MLLSENKENDILDEMEEKEGNTLISSYDPSTNEMIGHVQAMNFSQVIQSVEKAREGFKQWSRTSFEYRKKILLRIVDLIEKNVDIISEIISKENGKPRAEAMIAEIFPSVYNTKWVANNAKKILHPKKIKAPIWKLMGKTSHVEFHPKGVVGIISPWNYPWAIPFGQITTALMAGNSVVFKPSSLVPFIGEKIRDILYEGGVPENVFVLTQGPGRIGEGLIDGGVDHLVFTGSVEVGRHVNTLCAGKFISTTMELGGKDPMIVLDDADADAAAAGAIWGAFANSGQTCASIERVYVLEGIYDVFIEKVYEKSAKLRQGPDLNEFSVDVGPMTSKAQQAIVKSHIEDARKKGATIRSFGEQSNVRDGNFIKPTVITEIDETMLCLTEETFGPTLPIVKVKTAEEAIRLANNSNFGLTASIWSKNVEKAKRLASKIVTGTVTINDALTTFGMGETPWGGVKESGMGRTHGEFGLMEMTRPLHVCVDKVYNKKKLWWYPYDRQMFNNFKNGLTIFTQKGYGEKLSKLVNVGKGFSIKNKY